MTHENLKDGASYNNKAASIGTNVDTLSSNMNNMNLSNSEGSVSKGAGRGKEAEMTSNKKVSTSCAQNFDHKNDIGTREQHTTNNGGTSDTADKNFISDDDLFKVPPSQEDCPICMQPMPFVVGVSDVSTTYMICCGKTLCHGCTLAAAKEIEKRNMKEWCAFCRVPYPHSNKEIMKRLKKRMRLNDAEAFFTLGCSYHDGDYGLPKNWKKSFELVSQAAELGSINAHYDLSNLYYKGEGVKKDINKAIHHWQLAAIGGHEIARHNLGIMEGNKGNISQAMKHYMIAARCGYDDSLKNVGEGYKRGYVTKDDYANTLRAHQLSVDEMKSDERTKSYCSL